jgi:hypothetical protein
MKDVSKRIEVLANVAIIVVAILLAAVLARNYLFGGAGRPNRDTLTPGKKLSIDGVDWAKNDRTLLLVVAKNCHFCSESAPFYQRLDLEVSQGSDVKLLAIVPHDVQQGREYLDGLKVRVDDVKQADINSMGIGGTPTVVMVGSDGVVKNVWTGKLPPETESQVIEQIRYDQPKS